MFHFPMANCNEKAVLSLFLAGMECAFNKIRPMWPARERIQMKTIRTTTAMTATLALLGLGSVGPAMGSPYPSAELGGSPNPAINDQSAPATEEKAFEGDVTAVNQQDKTFSVKDLFFTRTFDMGNDCKISLQDKHGATTLAELHPGQDVVVHYEDYDGVMIARDVSQHDLTYTGHISAIDLGARKLTIKRGIVSHSFVLGPECAVTMQSSKSGTLNNLQIGDSVCVTYEPANGSHVARLIKEKGAEFVGTIDAVDTSHRIVEAKNADNNGAEKKFNLADNCSIVINGKLNGSMNNLRVGERVSFSYDNEDGVYVASRVTPMDNSSSMSHPMIAPSAQNSTGNNQLHAYNPYP
jgi:Cu/Ag efflux protein CusF